MKNLYKKKKQPDCIGEYKSNFLRPTEFLARKTLFKETPKTIL
jgi:hypothetical protein